jgi:hypothetical protein
MMPQNGCQPLSAVFASLTLGKAQPKNSIEILAGSLKF